MASSVVIGTMFGKSSNPADFQDVARPVAAMAKDFPSGFHITPHRHKRAQLLFAAAGVMAVSTPGGTWVVPPHRAVWVPAETEHEIRTWGAVAMRTLYIRDAAVQPEPGPLPRSCCVLAVSPLMRELILRAVELPLLYAEEGCAGRIMALILDEIRALQVLPLHLPLPRDARLRRICEAIRHDPAADHTLERWGALVGASPRTLSRRFRAETGLSFGGWRQQARLLEALGRLGLGQRVTSVALDLGYESPSAFTSMFRRALGRTPTSYFAAA